MAPPTPLECSGDGCGYSMPPGAPTWEITSNLLTAHTQAVHNVGGQQTNIYFKHDGVTVEFYDNTVG